MAGYQSLVRHEQHFRGTLGADMLIAFEDRVGAAVQEIGINPPDYRDVSVALHSRNDTPDSIVRAVEGIQAQAHIDLNNTEILLINAGNEQRTLDAARSLGAGVVYQSVGKHFRADMLNRAVEVAENRYVFQMAAHADMASVVTLAAARRHFDTARVGGVYGLSLPGGNASLSEQIGAHMLGVVDRLRQSASAKQKAGMGFLAGDNSMVDSNIIRALGGYPKQFGNGGADGQLGKIMLEKSKQLTGHEVTVVEDNAASTYHTHGYGPFRSPVQWALWMSMAFPMNFKPYLAKLLSHYGL